MKVFITILLPVCLILYLENVRDRSEANVVATTLTAMHHNAEIVIVCMRKRPLILSTAGRGGADWQVGSV
jgi:hypothetical protein